MGRLDFAVWLFQDTLILFAESTAEPFEDQPHNLCFFV